MKYGIAPVIKQALEEVYKAPFIVRILLAELGQKPEKDALLTINYDGTFEETKKHAVLAATKTAQARMLEYLKAEMPAPCSLDQGLSLALRTWAIGSLAHRQESAEETQESGHTADDQKAAAAPDQPALLAHLRDVLADKTLGCAVLDRQQPGSSKYRALKPAELARLLPDDFQSVVTG